MNRREQGFVPEEARDVERRVHNVASFETAKGSVYTYGEDGRVSRFKTATGEQDPPSDICVFLELDECQRQRVSDVAYEKVLGQELVILEDIGDNRGEMRLNLEEVEDPTKLSIGIWEDRKKMIAKLPATLIPTQGTVPLELSHRMNPDRGVVRAYRHLGNEVVKIVERE